MENLLDRIGRTAMLLVLAEAETADALAEVARARGYEAVLGRVGAMEAQKVVAAVETAARREGIIDERYCSQHALYHAILEALHGLGRGALELGAIMRTVGIRFAVVKGFRRAGDVEEGPWVAVAMYGTIGAPIRGHEHEAVGLGINHLGPEGKPGGPSPIPEEVV
ncbi:MAG: HutP family protein [Bacteroidota bacterium]